MAVKVRLSVYLDPELMNALAAYSDRRERSRSLIAEAAIASFLSPDADEAREAAITKRLDQIDRRMNRLERDTGIGVEMTAMFVRFWLSNAPPLLNPNARCCASKVVIATMPSWPRSAGDWRRGRRCGRRLLRMWKGQKIDRLKANSLCEVELGNADLPRFALNVSAIIRTNRLSIRNILEDFPYLTSRSNRHRKTLIHLSRIPVDLR